MMMREWRERGGCLHLPRLLRLGKSRSHVCGVIPELSPSYAHSYPHIVDNSYLYPQSYPQNVDNSGFSIHIAESERVALPNVP